PVAPCLLDQPGFVEQLVAIEDLLLVPGRAAVAEAQAQPPAAAEGAAGLRPLRARGPFGEQGQDRGIENLRPLLAPVLPRKEPVPGLEAGAGGAQRRYVLGPPGERQIADRDHVGAGIAGPRMTPAVS